MKSSHLFICLALVLVAACHVSVEGRRQRGQLVKSRTVDENRSKPKDFERNWGRGRNSDDKTLRFSNKVTDAATCGYESCNLGKPDMLNVHMVAHTHDDVGWLKTVDQYYYGDKNNIQHAGVQYILDSVISQLQNDPRKRFIYVEIAFFYRWWLDQHDSFRHVVKNLVNQGRLEFILGGWCMNDEAATHYNAIIDQHTIGFRFLKQNFGVCGIPKIGWQIDPFGHSREQASIFAQFGFDGLFFGRLDYQDKEQRLKTKTMEHIWLGSQNLGVPSALFTGVNYNGYGPPEGFCFDQGCEDEPLMDNPALDGYNVDKKVKEFITAAKQQASNYTTNHIMFTMGSDFQFENAMENYKNLDKLLHYVNAESAQSGVNVLYSSPSCYLYALNQANQTYTVKTDDFFPYASRPNTFWTGYFTSRPALKYYVRNTNNLLQVCKQLDVLANLGPQYGSALKLDVLRRAMGVAQHHDAVSGTEKQAVANDYAKRLAAGVQACQDVVNYAYTELLPLPGTTAGPEQQFCSLLNVSSCPITETSSQFTVIAYNPIGRSVKYYARLPVHGAGYKVMDDSLTEIPSQIVPLTPGTENIPEYKGSQANATLVFQTVLPPLGMTTFFITRTSNDAGLKMSENKTELTGVKVNIINPTEAEISWNPVIDSVGYSVHYKTPNEQEWQRVIEENTLVLSDLLPGATYSVRVRSYSVGGPDHNAESSTLTFTLPPLTSTRLSSRFPLKSKPIEIENEHLKLSFSASSGLLTSMTPIGSTEPVHLSQSLMYYQSYKGNNSEPRFQSSGAYVFRPNGSIPLPLTDNQIDIRVTKGDLVQEVHQTFNSWATQTVRLYKDTKYAEFEWTVGPIPVGDGIGKEVISQFLTDWSSNGVFYTDANGREILKRVRDFRPTWKLNQTEKIAGNYYPVNSRIYIRDEAKGMQLTVLTDRSQGGSSIHDGQIELMVHRRMLVDDLYGVGEALNETGITGNGLVVRGRHYVLLSSIKEAASLHRDMAEQLFMAPSLTFSPIDIPPQKYKSMYRTQWSGLTAALPPNVHVLTLEEWEANSCLLRLEHFYEHDEDPVLSQPASVSIQSMFSDLKVESVEELTLGGNQKLSEAKRLQWNAQGLGRTDKFVANAFSPMDPVTKTITLQPMQIRTFQVFFEMTPPY